VSPGTGAAISQGAGLADDKMEAGLSGERAGMQANGLTQSARAEQTVRFRRRGFRRNHRAGALLDAGRIKVEDIEGDVDTQDGDPESPRPPPQRA